MSAWNLEWASCNAHAIIAILELSIQVFDSVLRTVNCFCSCIKFTLNQTAIEVIKPTRLTHLYIVAIKDAHQIVLWGTEIFQSCRKCWQVSFHISNQVISVGSVGGRNSQGGSEINQLSNLSKIFRLGEAPALGQHDLSIKHTCTIHLLGSTLNQLIKPMQPAKRLSFHQLIKTSWRQMLTHLP